ncbi:UDP-N-acetylglucosamine 2-epimerase [bacterium]|nr:UDP-N-acetylglucosamine 2-epimerase [bacterium]
MKVFLIAGARPNFMKIAPIWKEIKKHPAEFEALIVHTGQHYDYEMSKSFFEQLVLPEPDFYLGVGSASQAVQTAKIMVELEKIAIENRPDLIVLESEKFSHAFSSNSLKFQHLPLSHY